MLIIRLSLVPSFVLQSARIKMPKSSFSCRHCSATFSYADSLRRHSILQHAVKVRVDSSGQQEEFEVEDWERECDKIRRRQSKSPYVKKDQRDHTSDRRQLPEKHADPKPKPKPIPSLMSLRLDTPEVIHGKESTPMGSNSSLSVANKTMRAHVQVPTVDHSPSFYLNASFRSLTPPGGISTLPDVEGTASPSANPLLPGTPGAVSSESECNLSLCRGVRLAAPEPSIPVSLHIAALDLSATSAVEVSHLRSCQTKAWKIQEITVPPILRSTHRKTNNVTDLQTRLPANWRGHLFLAMGQPRMLQLHQAVAKQRLQSCLVQRLWRSSSVGQPPMSRHFSWCLENQWSEMIHDWKGHSTTLTWSGGPSAVSLDIFSLEYSTWMLTMDGLPISPLVAG
jgi:hypothetical protein